MNNDSKLLKLLSDKSSTKDIFLMVEKLEVNSNFSLSRDIEKLKGIWELRWSSSNSRLLNYSSLIDNLQILNPSKSNAMNLLKPKGIKAIIGTGIIAKLNPINDKRIGVEFTHAGLIGPKIGVNKIKALARIEKEQKGWLDITYISNNIRLCRGDKGTLFILKKREDSKLFKRFEEFIIKFSE